MLPTTRSALFALTPKKMYLNNPEMLLRVVYFIGMWSVSKSSEEDNKEPEKDVDWLQYVDDSGNTHVINFSFLPTTGDGFIYGDAYFSLYTRNNANEPEKLSIPEENSTFNSTYLIDTNPLAVLTHGWFSDDKTQWLQNIKNSLLKKSDTNVITVDWSELAKNPLYHWAAMTTRYVGKKLAKLINAITESCHLTGQGIYLIGHSLGAHIMGYTGMFSNQRIHRITGLDPARPLFEVPLMPFDFRLDRSDADFVDIIHTSGGYLGYKSNHGHADFYPNNGTVPQPGCQGLLAMIQSCSHGRSCLYFEESIGYESGGFVAHPCQNWETEKCICEDTQLMGYPLSSKARGDYYLRTNNQSLFAITEE